MKYKILGDHPRPDGRATKIEVEPGVVIISDVNGTTRCIGTSNVNIDIEDDDKPAKKPQELYEVPYIIGDGTDEIMLEGIYIHDGILEDEQGRCAFCHGDPCAEDSDETTLIGAFFKRNKGKSWADTCPMCGGRPS